MALTTSDLARQLDIRFIDARNLINQAKLNLQIHGYVEEEQIAQQIHDEALRLFQERHISEQLDMKRANWCLEATKISRGSSSLSPCMESSSVVSSSSSPSSSRSDMDTSSFHSSCSDSPSFSSYYPMFMSEESSCSWWGNSVRCLRMPSVNQATS